MRILLATTLVVAAFSSCAHQADAAKAAEPTFEAFRGGPIAVRLTDTAAVFAQNAGVVDAVKQAVERELISRAIPVADTSERVLIFEIVPAQVESRELDARRSCVRVTGHLKENSPFTSTRCPGDAAVSIGARAVQRNLFTAIESVQDFKAREVWQKDQGQALSEAIAEVVGQIDSSTREEKQ